MYGYIYLHLPQKLTQCREICHTWILWVCMLSIWIFFQEDIFFSNQQIPFLEIPGFRILHCWRYAVGSNLRPGDHFGSRRARGWGLGRTHWQPNWLNTPTWLGGGLGPCGWEIQSESKPRGRKTHQWTMTNFTRWWHTFHIFGIFTPNFGEDFQFD